MGNRIRLGKMENPVRGFLHGSAAIASIVGTVMLIVRARSLSAQLAVTVFGLSLIALFTTSSLYHAVPWRPLWKARMQRLDHSMILLLVAGSFTPLAVIVLGGPWGIATMAVVWGLAAFGMGRLALTKTAKTGTSIALSTTMGWLGLFLIVPLGQRVGMGAVLGIAAGGIVYTVGMVLMVTQRPRLWPRVFSYHEVFHILVIVASATHWMVTYRWVAPYAAA